MMWMPVQVMVISTGIITDMIMDTDMVMDITTVNIMMKMLRQEDGFQRYIEE